MIGLHHDPLAVLSKAASTRVGLEYGRAGFLDLQQEGIVLPVTQHQHDVALGADTSDADHFAG